MTYDVLSLNLDLDHHPALRVGAEKVVAWFNGPAREVGGALALIGPPGVGKTHIARRCALAWGAGALYCTEPGMVGDLRRAMNGAGYATDDVLAALNVAPFLVVDDVGAAWVTEAGWLHDVYCALLDGRLEAGRPTLLTSNLSYADFRRRVGSRALDRLVAALDGGAWLIDLSAVPSYRARRREAACA